MDVISIYLFPYVNFSQLRLPTLVLPHVKTILESAERANLEKVLVPGSLAIEGQSIVNPEEFEPNRWAWDCTSRRMIGVFRNLVQIINHSKMVAPTLVTGIDAIKIPSVQWHPYVCIVTEDHFVSGYITADIYVWVLYAKALINAADYQTQHWGSTELCVIRRIKSILSVFDGIHIEKTEQYDDQWIDMPILWKLSTMVGNAITSIIGLFSHIKKTNDLAHVSLRFNCDCPDVPRHHARRSIYKYNNDWIVGSPLATEHWLETRATQRIKKRRRLKRKRDE